jgi:hypothetical protein
MPDVLMAFPPIILPLAVAAVFGHPSMWQMTLRRPELK